MRTSLPAGLLLLAITGCGPTVRTTYLGGTRYPEGDSDVNIALYSARTPECPFEELALLTSILEDEWFTSRADALNALKEQARRLGAHAIVGLAPYDVPSGDDYSPGYKGTAVRFARSDCTR